MRNEPLRVDGLGRWMSGQLIQPKKVLSGALLLFLTLCCWSFSNPLGSTPDEWFHVSSISCAYGSDSDHCISVDEGALVGTIKVDKTSCVFRTYADVRRCGEPSTETLLLQNSNYPDTYYKVMNTALSLGDSRGFLFIRIFNGFFTALFFVIQILVTNPERRKAWLTGFTFTLTPMAVFLLSSIHPHAWVVIGCTNGWLFAITALTDKTTSLTNRCIAGLAWIVCGLMCLGSRYDGAVIFALTTIVGLVATQLKRDSSMRSIFLLSALIAAISVVFCGFSSSFRAQITRPFQFAANELGNSTWISVWIFQSLGAFVETLGTGQLAQQGFQLSPAISAILVSIVGATILLACATPSRSLGITSALCGTTLVYASLWFNDLMFRDTTNLNGRYILPLVPFFVAVMVYASKNPTHLMDSSFLGHTTIVLLSIAHALSLFSVTRTYVNPRAEGFLPMAIDESSWWWVGVPFGPNFIVLVGSLTFYRFLRTAWSEFLPIPQTKEASAT